MTTPIGSLADESFARALDPGGKIVVGGYTDQGTHDDFAIVRYNPDLTLDTTFDSDGIATLDMVGEDDRFNAVAIQSDGKIVAAGFFWTSGTNDMAVVRYNVDGTLDTTFDGDGIATVTMSGDDQARAVAIQDDGKIVVSGYTNGSGNYDFVVVRFNADGSKDTTFDGDGIAETDFGSLDNKGEAVAVQSDRQNRCRWGGLEQQLPWRLASPGKSGRSCTAVHRQYFWCESRLGGQQPEHDDRPYRERAPVRRHQ